MADLKAKNGNKSKLTLKTLSFFLSPPNPNYQNSKSPKKFTEQNGVVGLGIVAALNNESSGHSPVFAVSPRSTPIPIFSKKSTKEEVEIELLEEYTCVISHVGNNLIKKREYFDDGFKRKSGGDGSCTTSYWVSTNVGGGGGGVFCAPSPPMTAVAVDSWRVFESGDFLNCCYLCKKKLHGLDIFMYRGEKAFCSEECRYKQISIDERKEKYMSRVSKQPEYSDSPCSSPMQFLAGMAAA